MFSESRISFIPFVVGGAIVTIGLVGFGHALKTYRHSRVVELYVVFYLLILLATQFALDSGERYLAPIFVFLLLYFWQGATWLLK